MATIGPYEVVEELGRGAMGVVFRCFDPEIGRPVAIKVIQTPEFTNAQERATLMQRLAREAGAAGRLTHPNIVTVYQFGEHNGSHYLAMEFVSGRSLEAMLQEGPLSPAMVVRILAQVAAALDYAHQEGVIHRDIKPANILVRGDGTAKLADFGIARINIQPMTQTGLTLGTPPYMSPEQFMDSRVDGRADQFSLAVVAYEMLTGRRPFNAQTPATLMHQILSDDPPAPSDINATLPRAVSDVVLRALSKLPADRFDCCASFVNELSSAIMSQKALSKPAGGHSTTKVYIAPRGRPARWRVLQLRRRPWLLAPAALLLALVSYLLFSSRLSFDSLAILPFGNPSQDASLDYLAEGIPEGVIRDLSQASSLRVTSFSSALRYERKAVDPVDAGTKLHASVLLTGRIAQLADDVVVSVELVETRHGRHLWGASYQRKRQDVLSVQEDAAREIARSLRVQLAAGHEREFARRRAQDTAAQDLYLKGRFCWNKRTQNGLVEAIEYYQKALDRDPGFALAYAGLADAYALRAGRVPPREVFPRAKEEAARALRLDDTLAEGHAATALIALLYDWDYRQAEQESRKALTINPSYATAYSILGRTHAASGRFEDAIAELDRARQLDPLSSGISTALGAVYLQSRELARARDQYRSVLREEPKNTNALGGLAAVLIELGNAGEAIGELERAVALNPDDTGNMADLARAYGLTKQTSKAAALIDGMLRLRTQRYVAPYFLAVAYQAGAAKDSVFEWLDKAIEDRSWGIAFLGVDPRFDSVRKDPRFRDLLRRIRSSSYGAQSFAAAINHPR